MKNGIKRLIIAVVILSLICGGIYGGLKFYKTTNMRPVRVYSVSDVSYPADYFIEDSVVYGSVSLDRMQTVYVSGTQKVTEMLAEEGKQVKKGDVLFRYDTTLTEIQLERAENELEQQKLALQRAKDDLELLNRMSPSSESDFDDAGDIEEPTENEPEKKEKESPDLEPEETPVRISGSGKMNDPYIYLWSERDAFTSEELLLMFRPDGWEEAEESTDETGTEEIADESGTEETADETETAEGAEVAASALRSFGILPYTVMADELETAQEIPDEAGVEEGSTETGTEDGTEEYVEGLEETPDAEDLPEEEIPTEEPDHEDTESGEEPVFMIEEPVEEGDEPVTDISGSEAEIESSDMIIPGDDEHYVDLSGCPNEIWAILEVHESDNREGKILTRFGLHLIRSGQDVAVRLFNPDLPAEDTVSSDEEGTGLADDDSEVEIDDEEADLLDEEDDGDLEDDSEDYDEEDEEMTLSSASEGMGGDSDIDPEGHYTAKELDEMRKDKAKEVRDLDLTVRQSELSFRQAKEELGDGCSRAKINGVVKTVRNPEDAYQNNEPVVIVSGGGGYKVNVAVSELELDSLKKGDKAKVTSFSSGSASYDGEVISVSDYPDNSGDTGWFGGNPNVTSYSAIVYVGEDAELREGDYVSVKYGDSSIEDSLILDKMFVLKDAGGSYVYKRGEDGKLTKTYLKTGRTPESSVIEVLAGVTLDDHVAFPYGADVAEGAETEISDYEKLYEE